MCGVRAVPWPDGRAAQSIGRLYVLPTAPLPSLLRRDGVPCLGADDLHPSENSTEVPCSQNLRRRGRNGP